jgi:sulfite dehydrogenase (cytochrome) subunit A
VRSFIITPHDGARLKAGQQVPLKGIAFDEGTGIAKVEISSDGGKSWQGARLGDDLSKYSFRQWSATWTPQKSGPCRLMVRATNVAGETQPMEPLWNPAGYLRNVVEHIDVIAA